MNQKKACLASRTIIEKGLLELTKAGRTIIEKGFNRGRISSVGRALDCRAGGRGFDSRGRTNTQGLKTTENSEGTSFAPQAAGPSRGSDDHVK